MGLRLWAPLGTRILEIPVASHKFWTSVIGATNFWKPGWASNFGHWLRHVLDTPGSGHKFWTPMGHTFWTMVRDTLLDTPVVVHTLWTCMGGATKFGHPWKATNFFTHLGCTHLYTTVVGPKFRKTLAGVTTFGYPWDPPRGPQLGHHLAPPGPPCAPSPCANNYSPPGSTH